MKHIGSHTIEKINCVICVSGTVSIEQGTAIIFFAPFGVKVKEISFSSFIGHLSYQQEHPPKVL